MPTATSTHGLVVAAALALAGCSLMSLGTQGQDEPTKYVPPNPPRRPAELQGVAKAAKEEGLTGGLEISDLHTSDFGPGRWMICLRGERNSKPAYFGVYFDNEDYKGVRQSVIGEDCEHATYVPTGSLPDQSSPTDQTIASSSSAAKQKSRR